MLLGPDDATCVRLRGANRTYVLGIGAGTDSFDSSPTGSLAMFAGSTLKIYTHDDSEQLVAVHSNGTELGRYHYNSLGQRDSKVVNGQERHFVYDLQGKLIHEARADGTWKRDYVYLDGRLLSYIDTQGIVKTYYSVHADHLGTPQVITDLRGLSMWSVTYTPFGEAQIGTATIENNIRFPGQYFDAETGLHYNYHRYYDPQTGRYIESDPIGLRGGLNTYAYVGNNPIKYADPRGLLKLEVDKDLSQQLIDRIKNMAHNGGGTLSVPSLLSILNFPPDVADRINKARGDVVVNCPTQSEGTFSNRGNKITEGVPGAPISLQLILDSVVKGDVSVLENQINLDNLSGITADGPGPFNFNLDSLKVSPGVVDIDL